MKSKFLFGIFTILPFTAQAAIPYRVEQIDAPVEIPASGEDNQALARERRFYIGGAYDYSIWNDGFDGTVNINGKNTSSVEFMAGYRISDIFRIEANYLQTSAKWNAFELTGNAGMVNAIIDARIGNLYRMFYKQRLVPYIGIGAGASWNSVEKTSIENKISPVAGVLAGLGVEIGEFFVLDFGYRYMYMFSPKFEAINDFSPTAHQFRVGARVHF